MDLISPLVTTLQTPHWFLLLLFLYSLLVAVVLPTPVEVALVPLLTEPALWLVAALTIGAGKATGAALVFRLGREAETVVEDAAERLTLTKRFRELCIRFVAKTKYMGLYALLTLPFMSDTVPVYVYSLFNQHGQLLSLPQFLFANFLAGVNRALIVLIVLAALGITLVL